MKARTITIKETILIGKPREVVWDYTQNYDNRTVWDRSVIETIVLQTEPNRIVKLNLKGNTTMTFIYKLDDQPHKTTLVAKEIISTFIESAGGSWIYEEQDGTTKWTQTNTIVFKPSLILKLLLPIFKRIFSTQTRRAMKRAKKEIEAK